ncbi:hypothetical protein [Cedecea neteri]|uniref:hypothetical protein n=1 Tax=Cedecea neteri TaxID=158822 RepID=UPI00130D87EF|nr:hypothetical protein [Cedecea neteri]
MIETTQRRFYLPNESFLALIFFVFKRAVGAKVSINALKNSDFMSFCLTREGCVFDKGKDKFKNESYYSNDLKGTLLWQNPQPAC